MAGRKSKSKGYRFEALLVKLFNKAFNTNKIRRTPASGGLGIKGDLCTLEDNFELPGPLSKWCIEAKNQERISIWKCIEQARSQAGNRKWLLCFTKNREQIVCAMEINEFIELIQNQEKNNESMGN